MRTKQVLTVFVTLMLVTAGLTASAAGSVAAAESTSGDVTLTATYDNGTVSMTATDNGSAVPNATVYANDVTVATTDENGSASFMWNGETGDELTLAIEGENVSADATWVLENGSLVAPGSDQPEPSLANATVDAGYDNGTVDLGVVDNGTGVPDVNVTANDEYVGQTDENGSLSFGWQPAQTTDENDSENESQTYELDLVLEQDNTTREMTFTFENGTLAREEDQTRQGPPTDMPDQAADQVERIHELISMFLRGHIDAPLGQLMREVAGNHGNGHANGQADDHRENASEHNGTAAAGHGPDDHPKNATNAGKSDEEHGNGHGNHADEDDEDGEEHDDGGKAKGHD